MLKALNIQNFAIIDKLNLSFDRGVNIFSGETGAGKTIIIEAISFVLGEKAVSTFIRSGEKKAVVSALFEKEEEIFLKREINQQGKSTCFFNGEVVALKALCDIGNNLVDIHGQHEHQSLFDARQHLFLLDRYANLQKEQEKIKEEFLQLNQKEKRRDELLAQEKEKEMRRDLYQFQLQEIENAQLSPQDEEIEKEYNLLASCGQIQAVLENVYQALYAQEGAARERIQKAVREMGSISSLDERIKAFSQHLEEIGINLEESAQDLRGLRDSIQFDQQKLEMLAERRDLLARLKKKYGGGIREILAQAGYLRQELEKILFQEEELNRINGEIEDLKKGILRKAKDLSRRRKEIAAELKKKMERELGDLEMKKARLHIELKEKALGPEGVDTCEFLFSANPGEHLRPMRKIASGGEISRIMLGLKSIFAYADIIPSYIFDEIDRGIGGKVASSVGLKLKILGKRKQVFCITHLPQIASCGQAHFKVEKFMQGGRTRVSAHKLDEGERVEEIARMLSGKKITPASLRQARELLEEYKG